MASRIRGYKLNASGKLVPDLKGLDASAQARARGKPAKNPRRWRRVRTATAAERA